MACGVEAVRKDVGGTPIYLPLPEWCETFGLGYGEYDYEQEGAAVGLGGGRIECSQRPCSSDDMNGGQVKDWAVHNVKCRGH